MSLLNVLTACFPQPKSLMMQDFPYNFEDDVEHHNIWSTIPLGEKRVLEVDSSKPSSKPSIEIANTALQSVAA